MHQTLSDIRGQLETLASQIQSQIPNDEPLGSAHGNYSFPGLTKSEFIENVQSIIMEIDERGLDEIAAGGEPRLKDYVRRIAFLLQTVNNLWGSAAQAAPALLFTLDGLRKALVPALQKNDRADNAASLRKLSGQVRGMEARMRELEPRTTSLTTMVGRIESAYNAADQLPADLESLSDARKAIAGLRDEAGKDHLLLGQMRQDAQATDEKLQASAKEAEAVLARCETAYSAATSVGLAAAFSERSEALAKSMWFWVAGLVVALLAGSLFGSHQLKTLADLIGKQSADPAVIGLNFATSILSVAAPIWFAWLATKQIGQRFRLSEDYAFKASISRAYEGFRKEAARVDKNLEGRLLASALTRFDELPLRLVETESHGSPWHELASSEIVRNAIRAVPGFAEQVKDLAARALPAGRTAAKSNSPTSTQPAAE